jgi:SOS-response transcriptional repressor LexA
MQNVFREWLSKGLQQSGKSAIGLATEFGTDRSVVYKMMNGTRQIKPDELKIISRYIGRPVPSHGRVRVAKHGLIHLPIMGSVAAGKWTETGDGEESGELKYIPTVPDTEYPNATQIGFLVEGDSMTDAKIFDKDILQCVKFEDTGEQLANNMLVVIERYNTKNQVERSVKRVKVYNSRTEYHSCSNSKAYDRHNIIVRHNPKDPINEPKVKVVALVRKSIRDIF